MSSRNVPHRIYVFDEFTLDVDRGELQRAGENVKLRPKSLDVLCYLLQQHGRLVSREDLLEKIWGPKVVGDDAITQCLIDIRKAIEDPDHEKIRTVPRRGYMVDIPVQLHDRVERADAAPVPSRSKAGRRLWLVAGVSGLLVVSAIIWWRLDWGGEKAAVETTTGFTAAPTTIAVLPFLDMSPNQDQEYFADGMSEEILNLLAQAPELQVSSRTSAFSFKGQNLDVRTIAAKLNVAHVLEGSVRKSGDRLRITAQLVEADMDKHLWSQIYEEDVNAKNLFKVQERIAGHVADSLKVRLLPENAPKAPTSIDALDFYFSGMAVFRELQNGQDVSDAKFNRAAAKFQAAIDAEPDWLPPTVRLGQLYHWWSYGGSDTEKLQSSRRYLTEALERDPKNADALWSMGYVLWAEGDLTRSLEFYDKAIQLGGIRGWGHAITLSSLGRFDEAVAAYQAATPLFPVSLPLKYQLTRAMFCSGRFEDIVSDESRLIASWPDDELGVKGFLAESHARLGNREEAIAYVNELTESLRTEAYLAAILAAAGEHERARIAIDELVERDQGWEVAASAALQLGEIDKALGILERLDRRTSAGHTGFLLCRPEIRALAGNPRYDAMLRNRGLSPD